MKFSGGLTGKQCASVLRASKGQLTRPWLSEANLFWSEGVMARAGLDQQFVRECRTRLVEMKTDLLNRSRSAMREFENRERGGGDEADMTMALLAENTFLTTQERAKDRLLEIETALARIDRGNYGVCEETDEPIEIDRLRALPYTRLSIEGAEIRESLQKRFVR